MIPRSAISGALATIAVAGLLISCSSSKSSSISTAPLTTPSTSTTSVPAITEPSSTGPNATVAPTTGATTPSSSAATTAPSTGDTAAITAAFTTFFDGVNPDVDAKIAVLEHGDLLRSMIEDASKDPQFQQLSTTVNSVEPLSDTDCAAAGEVTPCALVGHDMFVGGLPAMVGLKSHAVKIDGVWKVSASSWCAVVAIGGATCPELPAG